MTQALRDAIAEAVVYSGDLEDIAAGEMTVREAVLEAIDYMTFDDAAVEDEFRAHVFTSKDYRQIERGI